MTTLDRCSICGDPGEPALCPDRHGWEDHCTGCVGACNACRGSICTCPDISEIDAAIEAATANLTTSRGTK